MPKEEYLGPILLLLKAIHSFLPLPHFTSVSVSGGGAGIGGERKACKVGGEWQGRGGGWGAGFWGWDRVEERRGRGVVCGVKII